MPFSKHVVMMGMTLAALSLPLPAFAQTAAKELTPAMAQGAAALAVSPAMRVFEGTITGCFQEVTNVDPIEAARTKNIQALNMDTKAIMRIQECMNKKGIPTNFDNYYSAKEDDGLGDARRKDLEAIQSTLDTGKASIPASTPTVATPMTSMPQPVMAPPQAVAPTPAAVPPVSEPEKPKVDPAEGGSGTKAPRPARQYWVKPE